MGVRREGQGGYDKRGGSLHSRRIAEGAEDGSVVPGPHRAANGTWHALHACGLRIGSVEIINSEEFFRAPG